MKIKYATFKSKLKYSYDIEQARKVFINKIEDELNDTLEYTTLDDYDCDLKLIFVETGGSEGLFLDNFDCLKEPFYILTNGSNNSLAASLEILNYIKSNGYHGEILHGDTSYISKKIKLLALLERGKKILNNTKLGVVGKPSDWLISSIPNYDLVKEKLGVDSIDIPLSKVVDKTLKPHFSKMVIDKGFNKEELIKASNIYDSLVEIVKEYELSGLTIRCFDLLKSLKSTSCLALGLLNKEGIVSTCEGDIATMLSMMIVKALTNKPSFQANPSKIEPLSNDMVLAHCTAPFDMLKSYKLDTHFESGIGVAIKGEMNLDKVTIFRLSSDLSRYYLTTGRIIKNMNESDLCRTQILVHLDSDIKELLKNPCGNHQVVIYGDESVLITEYMKTISAKNIFSNK